MAYQEYFSTRFSRKYKKLSPQTIVLLHDAMDLVLKKPSSGVEKTGDLSNLYIVKFKVGKLQWLLGYTFNSAKKKVTWEAVGPHENFYRDLKKN